MSSDKMKKADGKEAVQDGADARVIIEAWRRHFNKVCPHASPGYRAPAPASVRGDDNLTIDLDHSMGADHQTSSIRAELLPSAIISYLI